MNKLISCDCLNYCGDDPSIKDGNVDVCKQYREQQAKKSRVQINLDLPPQQALALAQFVKRVGFQEVRINAVDDDDAYTMMDAINKLQMALAEAGYAPR